MHKSAVLLAAVSLALSACSEDSSSGSPQPDSTASPVAPTTISNNPQSPASTTPTVGTQSPVTTAPTVGTQSPVTTTPPVGTQTPVTTTPPVGTQTPVTTTPPVGTQTPVTTTPPVGTQTPVTTTPPVGTQTPVTTTPPVGTAVPAPTLNGQPLSEFILNGRNSGQVDSEWRCTDFYNPDPSDYVGISFFADNSGSLSIQQDTALINWNVEHDSISISNSVGASFRVDSISILSALDFQGVFVVPDGTEASAICELFDVNGNQIQQAGQNAGSSSGQIPVQPASANLRPLLVNAETVDNVRDFWECALDATGSEMAIVFIADGTGVYIDEENSDGLSFSWSAIQDLQLAFSNGVNVIVHSPMFQGNNLFTSASINVDGNSQGSLTCNRYSL